jgi:hypothetical protein
MSYSLYESIQILVTVIGFVKIMPFALYDKHNMFYFFMKLFFLKVIPGIRDRHLVIMLFANFIMVNLAVKAVVAVHATAFDLQGAVVDAVFS